MVVDRFFLGYSRFDSVWVIWQPWFHTSQHNIFFAENNSGIACRWRIQYDFSFISFRYTQNYDNSQRLFCRGIASHSALKPIRTSEVRIARITIMNHKSVDLTPRLNPRIKSPDVQETASYKKLCIAPNLRNIFLLVFSN